MLLRNTTKQAVKFILTELRNLEKRNRRRRRGGWIWEEEEAYGDVEKGISSARSTQHKEEPSSTASFFLLRPNSHTAVSLGLYTNPILLNYPNHLLYFFTFALTAVILLGPGPQHFGPQFSAILLVFVFVD